MNLHRLRIFYYVAQFESVTEAANFLHISQPAVTAQIKKFEEELGVKLFQSKGRGIALTSLGRALYEASGELFTVEKKLLQLVSDGQAREGQVLRLASNLLGMKKILPTYLANFEALYPSVKIQLATLNSTDTLGAVVTGTADFGISGSQVKEYPQLSFKQIYHDRLVLLAGPTHPLRDKQLDLEDLSEHAFIGREKDSYTQKQLLAIFKTNKLPEPRFSAIFNYSQGAIEATKAGQGIHYCSESLVEEDLHRGELIKLGGGQFEVEHPIYLSWLREAPLTEPQKKMRELLSEEN